jgi:hypothetical protein
MRTPDMAAQVQWFNFRGNPICHYYSKAETLRRIAPLHQVLDESAEFSKVFAGPARTAADGSGHDLGGARGTGIQPSPL